MDDPLDTTRTGIPTLWGIAEMTIYADQVADRLGKPRPGRGRAWTWDRIEGFPKPLARLHAGNVYLAEEVRPWIEERISMERFRTTPIDEPTRQAILADQGTLTTKAAAVKHRVSTSSVNRIWIAGAEHGPGAARHTITRSG